MCVVSINVPEEILLDIHEDMNDFSEYMKKCLRWICIKTKRYLLVTAPVSRKCRRKSS